MPNIRHFKKVVNESMDEARKSSWQDIVKFGAILAVKISALAAVIFILKMI